MHERGSIRPSKIVSPPAKGVLSVQGNASFEAFHPERGAQGVWPSRTSSGYHDASDSPVYCSRRRAMLEFAAEFTGSCLLG
jgi:hypothetical protein